MFSFFKKKKKEDEPLVQEELQVVQEIVEEYS